MCHAPSGAGISCSSRHVNLETQNYRDAGQKGHATAAGAFGPPPPRFLREPLGSPSLVSACSCSERAAPLRASPGRIFLLQSVQVPSNAGTVPLSQHRGWQSGSTQGCAGGHALPAPWPCPESANTLFPPGASAEAGPSWPPHACRLPCTPHAAAEVSHGVTDDP